MTKRPAGRALLIACVALTSCQTLTDVELPIVDPSAVGNPLGAEARYAAALSSFTTAMASTAGSIVTSALFTDEFVSGLQISNGATFLDARRLPEGPLPVGVAFTTQYEQAHTARLNILDAAEALQTFAPLQSSRIAELLSLHGFVEVVFAEQFCSGVPFSRAVAGVVEYGTPLSTADLQARAIAHFDSALVLAVDSARVLNLARIGKGRALLSMGRFADAATAVAGVPSSYVYRLQIAAEIAGQQNGVFLYMNTRSAGVASNEGSTGLDFRTANDPRVPTVFMARGLDGVTDVYRFAPYATTASPITFASGVEARLIEAEAALNASPDDASTTGSGWLGILNSLRATAITPALPQLSDPGSFNARVNLLFRERAFWLYLTGHRMGDLRRLVRHYNRAPETVFPSGTYKDGEPYGSDVTLPVPTTETRNPHFTSCIERTG